MKINDEVIVNSDEKTIYHNSFDKRLSNLNVDFGQSKFHRRLKGTPGKIVWINDLVAIVDHSSNLEDFEVAIYFLDELILKSEQSLLGALQM